MLNCLRPIYGLMPALVLAVEIRAEPRLDYPAAITGSNERVYVADRHAQVVWAIDGERLSVFFKGSGRFQTPLAAVQSLALDGDGRLLVGDSATREVYRLDEQHRPVPLSDRKIGIPTGIVVNSKGSIFVSDLETQRIWKLSKEGGEPAEFATVAAPRGLALDRDENLWVVSHGKNQIILLHPDGEATTPVEGRPFELPLAIAIDPQGNAFVTDAYAGTIWRVSASKKPEKFVAGGGLEHPVGLAWHQGELLVSDTKAKAIFRVDSKGTVRRLSLNVMP